MAIRFPGFVAMALSLAAICLDPASYERTRFSFATRGVSEFENTPPLVKIVEPRKNSVYPSNSLVRYSISVSDREDGDSKFDEIPADKIFLEIRFVNGSPDAWDVDTEYARKEPSGLSLLKNSDCFTCHQFASKLIGPSFREIADRYAEQPGQKQIIAKRIIDGSKGTWGESVMPAHPDVDSEDAVKIVDWILRNGGDENLNLLAGKEGSVRVIAPPHAAPGFFVMRATYTDQGTRGRVIDGMDGEDFTIVRCR